VIGIASAPGVPQPVHAGDAAGASRRKLGAISLRKESSWGMDNVATPLPVVSETSATFFGLAMKVTGSKRAMALAVSE
jgi:hypothetical protein